jgi:hypothetical protein
MDEEEPVDASVRPAATTEEAFQEALRQLVLEADATAFS